ncbi:hypothetical protein PEX1_027670 [Penicillium expansum]|uniref:Secreted protein n=1 Tax=Penicillium expansum TaxID=27334 RepID=A0A0A2IV54_PENEN|nr:hypothetical protein PEX2_091390 [Penicillium expansum]KGO46949.1 hypothetical protein PEXP_066400 [Penicillium expansum]KGO47304.1 hypothetical protein PEX1_027670 [Penicillium expansum]KGO58761.1 hypothetical protein PEX2_091390 [Penicillium expansum]
MYCLTPCRHVCLVLLCELTYQRPGEAEPSKLLCHYSHLPPSPFPGLAPTRTSFLVSFFFFSLSFIQNYSRP